MFSQHIHRMFSLSCSGFGDSQLLAHNFWVFLRPQTAPTSAKRSWTDSQKPCCLLRTWHLDHDLNHSISCNIQLRKHLVSLCFINLYFSYFFITYATKQSLLIAARRHMVRIWSPGMCEWQNWRCVVRGLVWLGACHVASKFFLRFGMLKTMGRRFVWHSSCRSRYHLTLLANHSDLSAAPQHLRYFWSSI